jgi:hypothetical protein
MAHETTIRKNAHGQWTAKTIIMLSDTHQFSLTTSKRGDGYVTSHASVGHVSADGRSVTYAIFEDYSKTLHSQKYPRVTQKIIESQHAEILVDIDDWVNEARAKYGLELQYA